MRIYLDDSSKLGINFLYFLSKSSLKNKVSIILADNHKINEEDLRDQVFLEDLDYRAFGSYVVKKRLSKYINLEEVLTISSRLVFEEIVNKYKINLFVSLNFRDYEQREYIIEKLFIYNIPSVFLFVFDKPKIVFVKNFKEEYYERLLKYLKESKDKYSFSIKDLLFINYSLFKILNLFY